MRAVHHGSASRTSYRSCTGATALPGDIEGDEIQTVSPEPLCGDRCLSMVLRSWLPLLNSRGQVTRAAERLGFVKREVTSAVEVAQVERGGS